MVNGHFPARKAGSAISSDRSTVIAFIEDPDGYRIELIQR
jgi:hypothetical protein